MDIPSSVSTTKDMSRFFLELRALLKDGQTDQACEALSQAAALYAEQDQGTRIPYNLVTECINRQRQNNLGSVSVTKTCHLLESDLCEEMFLLDSQYHQLHCENMPKAA